MKRPPVYSLLLLGLVYMVGQFALNHLPPPPWFPRWLQAWAPVFWSLGCGGALAWRLARVLRSMTGHDQDPPQLRW